MNTSHWALGFGTASKISFEQSNFNKILTFVPTSCAHWDNIRQY